MCLTELTPTHKEAQLPFEAFVFCSNTETTHSNFVHFDKVNYRCQTTYALIGPNCFDNSAWAPALPAGPLQMWY